MDPTLNTPDSLDLPAPAKLNLMLRIVGRRQDGYHRLQTVFQLLDVGDRLRLTRRTDGRIRRIRGAPGVAEHEDLVVRAAHCLQERTACPSGCDITVDKRLPMGGGLGGGSSDAATTLLGLNRLWELGLTLDELAEIGLSLGADVPVFVRGRSAWGEGIGECLTPVTLPPAWYVVLCPQVHVATAELFAHPGLTRDAAPITMRAFFEGLRDNIFQPLVAASYPPVAEALDWLSRSGEARLTGTGACLFAAFESEATARQVLDRRPVGLEGFVARGVNLSPLHEALGLGIEVNSK